MIVTDIKKKGINMKKIIALSSIAFLSTVTFASTDMQTQIDELTAKITKMEKTQKKLKKKVSNVNRLAAKDNIKWDVDFRTSYDNITYKTVAGTEYKNDSLLSNRLWLGMGYAPTENILFRGQLSFNKAFGASYGQRGTGMGFDTFDWVVNESLTDDKIRLREAYWLYTDKFGDFGVTASVGRRPSTNGHLSNFREDDKKEKSPNAHVINMEFDGASASVKYDKLLPGLMFKICLGRGLTNAQAWGTNTTTGANIAYAEDSANLDVVDMAGFIFVPYDDGQYSVKTTWYRGLNLPGMMDTDDDGAPDTLQTTGNMDGAAISLKAEGIGDGINDFLDDTTVFLSYATTTSDPDGGRMLGSTESETGNSIWVGVQVPNMTGGKFGLEYNQGSEHWRPFTYGEDTMIGSKIATRGSAIEAYWTQPLIEKVFSMQVRYTSITYDYTGSNAFFGDGGTAMAISDVEAANGAMGDPVETAQDIRVYFRYRY